MAEEEQPDPNKGDGSDRPRRSSSRNGRDNGQGGNPSRDYSRNSNFRGNRDDNRRPYQARSDRDDRPDRTRWDRNDGDRRPYQFRGDRNDERTGNGGNGWGRNRGDGGRTPFGRGNRQQDFHPRRRDNNGAPRGDGEPRPWRRNNAEDAHSPNGRSRDGWRHDGDTRPNHSGYQGRGNYGRDASNGDSRTPREDRNHLDRGGRPRWNDGNRRHEGERRDGYQGQRGGNRRQDDGYRWRGSDDRPNSDGERQGNGYGRRGDNDRRNNEERGFRPNRGGYQGRGGPDRRKNTDQGSRGGYAGGRPQRRPLREDSETRGLHNGDNGRDSRPQREWLSDEEYQRRRQLRTVRPRVEEPEIPDEVRDKDLDFAARLELKTLSKENAENVARHLVMASRLIEDDPEAAHQHALAASRRAGRVAVVRETLGITAYAIGDFALALRELRTYRRISGRDDQIALLVDSERGIGRPEKALEEGRSVDRSTLNKDVRAQLAIAMSGARLDLGQSELALVELDIPELNPDVAYGFSPELFAAYAEVLDELGRDEEAARWRERAETAEEALNEANDTAGLETISVEVVESDDEDVPGDCPATTTEEVPGATDEFAESDETANGENNSATPQEKQFETDERLAPVSEASSESEASSGESESDEED